MLRRFLAPLVLAVLLNGCVSAYSLLGPGETEVGSLRVTADGSWNSASAMQTPYSRKGTQVWTRDGLLLDRLMIIPDIAPGEALFRSSAKDAALPVFRADMLPNEIAELVESSIVKVLGEGEAAVSTSNLRPQKFGEQRGALFDLDGQLSDGPNYRGVAGGFVANDRLYLVIFLAATPHYDEKHRDAAEAILRSARL